MTQLKATSIPRLQRVTDKALEAFEKIIHIQASSGIVLLLTALVAIILANSQYAEQFEHFWHTPISIGFGSYVISHSIHFWINDGLMTIFFLVVGMEIRREMHEGTLSNLSQASLPIIAALGGVLVPAIIYLQFATTPEVIHGWAIPTATDIAFAVGILALLGKSIPLSVRIFLLTLAIIDDIVAVILIALFYSSGLDVSGFFIAIMGLIGVFFLQWCGIGNAWVYVIPGFILWTGFLKAGIHPTLAGVVLGLLTPLVQVKKHLSPIEIAKNAINELSQTLMNKSNPDELMVYVKKLKFAQRELLAPVVRVQLTLHPWVAFLIMPLFAFANAGVSFSGVNFENEGAFSIIIGTSLGLLVGKVTGVVLFSWVAVKTGLCRLPQDMTWAWVILIGLLAGIGFTMSIFIANLAFSQAIMLSAAKMGVILGSLIAGLIGLTYGFLLIKVKK